MKLKPRLDKLRKLAAHLRTVPPENFDFGTVWCGTVGCAMGHAVSVFPEELELGDYFEEDEFKTVRMCDESGEGYDDCAEILFNLTPRDAIYLFSPDVAPLIHPHLPSLEENATPAEVAGMLEQFCQLVESGKLEQYENMSIERTKRTLTDRENAVIDELYRRKGNSRPTNGYVTTTAPVPMGSKDDSGPWNGNPDRIIPPGTTLKIVMISRFEDFGLTDDLTADYGYHVRLDLDDAAITNIRLTPDPAAVFVKPEEKR